MIVGDINDGAPTEGPRSDCGTQSVLDSSFTAKAKASRDEIQGT
jgi:hypothetical protein